MGDDYTKNFDAWNTYKSILNKRVFEGLFAAREVWWCALGVNIGSEQDGKNESFERPVLIIRKINRDRLMVVPITSKIGVHSDRVTIDLLGQESQLLFSQMRVVSSKRLLRRIQRLKTVVFQNIIIAIAKYILESVEESETPPFGGESRGPEATVSPL